MTGFEGSYSVNGSFNRPRPRQISAGRGLERAISRGAEGSFLAVSSSMEPAQPFLHVLGRRGEKNLDRKTTPTKINQADEFFYHTLHESKEVVFIPNDPFSLSCH